MNKTELNKLVKKHNGWWEKDVARFPTPHDKDQFAAELAKQKAGVLEAGVSAPATAGIGDCRKAAADLMLKTIVDKTDRRNYLLQNIQSGLSVINCSEQVRKLQPEIDALLWMMTCCGLVEIDDEARRFTACPEALRTTLSEVLGTR